MSKEDILLHATGIKNSPTCKRCSILYPSVKWKRPKRVCEIGETTPLLMASLREIIGVNTQGFQLTLDSFGVRHACAGHSQGGRQDQHPLTEGDILALPSWVFSPHTLQPGAASSPNQPQRIQLDHLDLPQRVRMVVILEVRPRRRQLVLVTMYKTKNG